MNCGIRPRKGAGGEKIAITTQAVRPQHYFLPLPCPFPCPFPACEPFVAAGSLGAVVPLTVRVPAAGRRPGVGPLPACAAVSPRAVGVAFAPAPLPPFPPLLPARPLILMLLLRLQLLLLPLLLLLLLLPLLPSLLLVW